MKNIKTLHTIPKGSLLEGRFDRINYCDSFQIPLPANKTVDQIANQVFQEPAWVKGLMSIRDAVVKRFGLKAGKGIGEKSDYYAVGSKGYFTVVDRNENEIVMAENDKHLDFKVSIFSDPKNGFAYVTTIVRVNNTLGRWYFAVVRPFHYIIVKRMTAQALK